MSTPAPSAPDLISSSMNTSVIFILAARSAITSRSIFVTSEGQQITHVVLERSFSVRFSIFPSTYVSKAFAARISEITPFFNGFITAILEWTLPNILWASSPAATIFPDSLSNAITAGSLNMIPFFSRNTNKFAVPRSIPNPSLSCTIAALILIPFL